MNESVLKIEQQACTVASQPFEYSSPPTSFFVQRCFTGKCGSRSSYST